MKNYSEITVKYLKEKKKRTLFTIVGIIISLSLISGVGFLGLSLKDYMYNLIINDGGDYECSFNGINYKNIKALKYDVDLEKVAVTTYEGVFTDIKNEKENYIDILKGDEEYFNIITSYRIKEGRVPENGDEIILNESAKKFFGININDEIVLNIINENNEVTDKTKTYKVVGFEKDKYIGGTYFSAYTLLENIEANKDYFVYFSVIDSGNKINTIYEKAKRFNVEDIMNINNDLLLLKGESTRDGINIVIKGIVAFVFAVIVIATIFLIYNAINISVAERVKQFGILRSIGATPRQISSIVFNEGIIMCLISVPLGVIFGYLGVKVTVSLLGSKIASIFNGDSMTVKFYPSIILFTLVLGLITILFACYGPAKRAGKVNVINVIKGNDHGEKIKYYKGTLVRKIFGVEGWIAYKNIRKNSKRFVVTILSLSISLIMFITFTTLNLKRINELKYIQKTSFIHGRIYEYKAENSSEVEDKLKEIKDIDNIYRRQQITCNIVLDSNNLTDEFKRLYPGLLIDGDFTNEVFSYSENTLKEIEVDNLKDDEIILINSISRYNEDGKLEKIDITNYKEGDIIKIPAASLKYMKIMDMEECKKAINEDIKNNNYMEFKVKKIVDKDLFSNDYNCNFQLIINENKFNELFKDQYYNRDLGYRYPDINDNEQVEKIISKVNSVANEYGVAYIDFVKDNKVQEEMWTIINVFIYGFIIMVTLIGVVNVVNTITLNILLKKKEYGTLETIGMDIRQLNKMVILEGLLHGIISSIVGGVIAVILSKIAIRIVGYGFTLNDGLYLSPFIIGIIANLIIVLIASLIPLRKLKKMTLVETIKASE